MSESLNTTPEQEIKRLEGYKEMLLEHLERTLQQADKLAWEIEEIDRAILDETPAPVLEEDDKWVRGTE